MRISAELKRLCIRLALAGAASFALVLPATARTQAPARVHPLPPPAILAAGAKQQRPPQLRKLSSRLGRLVAEVARHKASGLDPALLSDSFQKVGSAGEVQLYVSCTGDPGSVASLIEQQGGKVERISGSMKLVQCRIPHDRIESVASDPRVIQIRLPGYAMPRSGAQLSQGDSLHKTGQLRAAAGYDGSGIKVGVISDGIGGISQSQASGDIPPVYQALSARADGNLATGAEGTAMMEIVHDLAPGAPLAFSNPETSADMVEAIDILDSTFGCKVITDDLGFADEPFFEDGAIGARINQAVAGGALYTSACGNAADSAYYEGDYAGITTTISRTSMNVHDFGGGDWNMQAYVPGKGGTLVVLLQWNDPWGGSANDYDLLLTTSNGSQILEASQDPQTGSHDPWEGIGYTNNSSKGMNVYIVVRNYSGANRHLKITTWGDGYLTEHWRAAGSIWGHPAAEGAMACAAVRWSSPTVVEYFSSRGPVRLDFPTLVYRNKPDISGADGVSVTANGGFYNPFYGTSAAAPHIAAVLAQVWGAFPAKTNSQIRALVESTATDLAPAGWDAASGYGLADAMAAVAPADTSAPTVLQVTGPDPDGVYGENDPVSVRVVFSEPVIVDTSGGTPVLQLNTSPARTATYQSGSGTSSILLQYEPQACDSSAHLDAASSAALEAGGAVIADEAGNTAVLTLPEPGAPGSFGANRSIAIAADETAPSVPQMTCETISVSTPVVVAYSGATDNCTDTTVHLWVRKGTPGDWTDSGLSSPGPSGAFEFSGVTGDATYFFAATTSDSAGNTSALPTGDGACSTLYDTTPPGHVSISDQGSWTPSLTTLRATWTPAEDEGAGIAGYDYAVGTSATTQDVQPWTELGDVLAVAAEGLSLAEGQEYFVQVRARDKAGFEGEAAASDGITAAPGVERIGEAWALVNGQGLSLRRKVVTFAAPGALWLQEADRSAAIKVLSNESVSPGDLVSVAGVLDRPSAQRVLLGDVLEEEGTAPVPPSMGMLHRFLGGRNMNELTPGATGSIAIYNAGLLCHIWGRVTGSGDGFFYLDDGANLSDGGPYSGVRVECGSVAPPEAGLYVVSGVENIEAAGPLRVPVITVDAPGDIVRLD